jgi:hypothetical protein
MDARIYVFGHGDTRPVLGFPTANDFMDFIREDVFRDNCGRYRHSSIRNPNIVLLSRAGRIFGHFTITATQDPTGEDLEDYDRTRRVYIVSESVLYEHQVPLTLVGIGPINFAPRIESLTFNSILIQAGTLTSYRCPI